MFVVMIICVEENCIELFLKIHFKQNTQVNRCINVLYFKYKEKSLPLTPMRIAVKEHVSFHLQNPLHKAGLTFLSGDLIVRHQ